jgi:hypothetical protein
MLNHMLHCKELFMETDVFNLLCTLCNIYMYQRTRLPHKYASFLCHFKA